LHCACCCQSFDSHSAVLHQQSMVGGDQVLHQCKSRATMAC
jgi:hypothetical protein